MAWIELNGRNYRLRETVDGKQVTVVTNLGRFKQHAEMWKVDFERACAQGFTYKPPIKKELIREYLEAARVGNFSLVGYKRIPIDQMCDLFFEHHGPSVKGGANNHWRSAYSNLRWFLNVIKRRWIGKMSDEPTPHDVRDLIAKDTTISTKMRHLDVIARMFREFEQWNAIDGELPFKVKIPTSNPAIVWRSQMKPHEKKNNVDTRVLEPEEWARFSPHLKPRTRAICEIALRRFLSLADIRKVHRLTIRDGVIEGLREKSGGQFRIPVMSDRPTKYDFTNFRREFRNAQVRADMDKPSDHPLHFSPKDLRRTGATWAYRAAPHRLKEISIMLGHGRISTTELYLGIKAEDIAEVAAAVDKIAAKAVIKNFQPLNSP